MEFNIELALNQLSFGQVGICILKEIFKRGLSPYIFPIANVDVRNYKLDQDFKEWLESCINKSVPTYKRNNPGFRLWHLQGSQQRISDKQILFTFHETDELTPAEVNIIKNNNKVLFSSKYSKNIAENFGCNNVGNLPLGFDSDSFKTLDKEYLKDRITFGLGGKLEQRKNHYRILKLWADKFGNKNEYALNCAIFNPHLAAEAQENLISKALNGKRYWNINFLPFCENNEAYNDYLNSNNIFIGMSSCEGWGLPEFQSAALGKHVIILNVTGYKEWCNEENAVLVNPSGKIPIYDNIFFHSGAPFAQGNGFTFTNESFYEAIDKAIERFNKNPINESGLFLQKQYTYSHTVDKLLSIIKNL